MNKKVILLVLIFLLGFLIRVWHIQEAPPGLNRDEASIGYTAYSLMLTGRDEYGISWPISFKSFGDWKLPLYIYLDVPLVKIFGLTDFAVRFPSVLFGSLTIFIAYYLSKELFEKTEMDGIISWKRKIPILSAFLFALSPWSVHLSRTASEANVAVFFTSLGILLILKSLNHKWHMMSGYILLGLSLYIYHASHIFTVLLFLGFIPIFWRKYSSNKFFWVSNFIFIILSIFIYSQTLLVADKTKISGLFALSDPALVYKNVILDRLQHSKSPNFINVVFHNKILFTVENTLQNYIRSYSPEFLFITGGGNTQHNIPNFGNLYLWEAPFLLLGLAYLLVSKSKYKFLLIYWLILAPIAASITKDAPHTARMAGVMPLLDILIAIGFLKVTSLLTKNHNIAAAFSFSILFILFLFNFSVWADRYFVHFPFQRAAIWGEGYDNLISTLNVNKNFGVKEIIMSRPEYSPYIYFLFNNKVDPLTFQNTVIRYPETDEGFQHVAKYDNLSFRQIDWSGDLAIPDRLYIEWSEQLPKSATNSAILITKELITEMINKNKDVSNLEIGDLVISMEVGNIKLQNNESMFTLIKTAKIN